MAVCFLTGASECQNGGGGGGGGGGKLEYERGRENLRSQDWTEEGEGSSLQFESRFESGNLQKAIQMSVHGQP